MSLLPSTRVRVSGGFWHCVCEEQNTTPYTVPSYLSLWSWNPGTGHSPSEAKAWRPETVSKRIYSQSMPLLLSGSGVVKASMAAEHWGGSGTHHKTPGSRMYHSTSRALSFGWLFRNMRNEAVIRTSSVACLMVKVWPKRAIMSRFRNQKYKSN
ncbi:uncharacterized protein BO88DRAFT_36653 [Aspergillus vadensis CBS 113365]|uniref:Uncharacterized protein n=1 Tax=Aspergillus vadensis (strain CBS 113365 / IMI 142717 / IBT 24658) TaxID=1448311 RepID=A0A319BCB6_ASPVC|nr:hypothetical protein BO88DRAFT_36653 [Aspergillus vadensis CBS 113365]PYH69584.1 hypothetical protein BO88DRAFT_36653 [Aspergillus vadensis CBS 113365]